MTAVADDTTNIFDQLLQVVDICQPDFPEKEIELRFVEGDSHGISKESWLYLFRLMQESDAWDEKLPEEKSMDLFFSGSQRGTLFAENKSPPILIEKTLEGRHTLRHPSGFKLVLTAKRERVLKSNHLNWGKPVSVRSKRRYSFLHKYVRCDMTLVYTAATKELTHQSPPTFEVEFELRPQAADLYPFVIAAELIEKGLGLIKDLQPDLVDVYAGLQVAD